MRHWRGCQVARAADHQRTRFCAGVATFLATLEERPLRLAALVLSGMLPEAADSMSIANPGSSL